jgi:hypothetical protein
MLATHKTIINKTPVCTNKLSPNPLLPTKQRPINRSNLKLSDCNYRYQVCSARSKMLVTKKTIKYKKSRRDEINYLQTSLNINNTAPFQPPTPKRNLTQHTFLTFEKDPLNKNLPIKQKSKINKKHHPVPQVFYPPEIIITLVDKNRRLATTKAILGCFSIHHFNNVEHRIYFFERGVIISGLLLS